ncbi:hypothetical protein GCK32_005571 [Trichostrongylus colubriformis]|uniref:Uncharacterized protein n=1 Tax=Trichostrongylus colubriformis TaxID=6319 RepID=A0AAN8FJB7_TRICO
MAPYSVMVTGANRGIGLGLVREFLKNNEIRHVIATARDPDSADDLKEIDDDRLSIVKLEVTCDNSIKRAYAKVGFIYNLKCMFCNTGHMRILRYRCGAIAVGSGYFYYTHVWKTNFGLISVSASSRHLTVLCEGAGT